MNNNLAAGLFWVVTLLTGTSFMQTSPAYADDNAQIPEFQYIQSDAFNFAKIMPAPPKPGSLAAKADLEAVLQVQAWRTPEQIAWAKRVDIGDLFDFADILGEWFTEDNLPVTATLLTDVDSDLTDGIFASKDFFARPRPFVADAHVHPCVKIYRGTSYPSGHTVSFFVEAGVLAELFPDQRNNLFEFARKLAWGRVIAGVHYPTDLIAGRTFAAAIVEKLKGNAAFRTALEQSRAEIAAVAANSGYSESQ